MLNFKHTQLAQTVVFGEDVVDAVGERVAEWGVKRAFIVCDPQVYAQTDLFERVRRSLGRTFAGEYHGVQPHSPIEAVVEGASQIRQADADSLISIGGGSQHDATKAMAILLAEGGTLRDHRAVFEPPDKLILPSLNKPKFPIATIPTTLAGAELTHSLGITDRDTVHKLQFVDPNVAPRLVVYDVSVARTTPTFVLLASGMNTINHCVETIYSKRHQPVSDNTAFGALAILLQWLPRCSDRSMEAIQQVQIASMMSVQAMTNTWVGINHAVGHCLGARYGILHGLASSIMLPHGMRFNLEATADRQALLAKAFGIDTTGLNDLSAGKLAAESVSDFSRRLGLPQHLREVGVPEEGLELLARDAMRDRQMYTNPRVVDGYQKVLEVLRNAW